MAASEPAATPATRRVAERRSPSDHLDLPPAPTLPYGCEILSLVPARRCRRPRAGRPKGCCRFASPTGSSTIRAARARWSITSTRTTCERRRWRSAAAHPARRLVVPPSRFEGERDVDLAGFHASFTQSSCEVRLRTVVRARAMNLVEAEATGPVEGDDPIVTPPRPSPPPGVGVARAHAFGADRTGRRDLSGVPGAPQRAR